jgi:hypothetical protein
MPVKKIFDVGQREVIVFIYVIKQDVHFTTLKRFKIIKLTNL